jgi:hypothetical protein
MKMTLLALLSGAIMACASHSSAVEPWRWPVDCPRLAAFLTSNPPNDSLWTLAMGSIYDCPDHIGPVLGSLWRMQPVDSSRQAFVHRLSENVSDRRLFQAVAGVLADTARPRWHRWAALAAFVHWVDSSAVLAVNPGTWRAPNGMVIDVTPLIGFQTHGFLRAGRNPLGSDDRRAMMPRVHQVAIADPVNSVQGVALFVDEWLRGLPPRPGQ